MLELTPSDQDRRVEKSIRTDKVMMRGPKPARVEKPNQPVYKLDSNFTKETVQQPSAQFSFLGGSAAGSSLQVISAEP